VQALRQKRARRENDTVFNRAKDRTFDQIDDPANPQSSVHTRSQRRLNQEVSPAYDASVCRLLLSLFPVAVCQLLLLPVTVCTSLLTILALPKTNNHIVDFSRKNIDFVNDVL
jgi:hypothetical protein